GTPSGGLTQGSDGSLYGTTYRGGAYGGSGYGTIFKVDAAGTLTTLHRFTYGVDGAFPSDCLVKGSDDSMYGTTSYGGAAGYGTVFLINSIGMLTTLYSFKYVCGVYKVRGMV